MFSHPRRDFHYLSAVWSGLVWSIGVLSDSISAVDVASFIPAQCPGLDRVTSIELCTIFVVGVGYDTVSYLILSSRPVWGCRCDTMVIWMFLVCEMVL